MSEELNRLREELKALDSLMGRHLGSTPLAAINADVSNRIAKLEAEAADPWREAKTLVIAWETSSVHVNSSKVSRYVRHLESELAAHKRALQHEKDFSGKLRGQLKDWEAAANIRSSVKISSPDDLGKRIAELETEVNAQLECARKYFDELEAAKSELSAAKERVSEWREAAFTVHQFHAYERTPDGLKAKLAALKANPQEVPPLDPWRVLRTAMKFTYDKMVINERDLPLWEISHEIIAKLINRNSPTTVHPYDLK